MSPMRKEGNFALNDESKLQLGHFTMYFCVHLFNLFIFRVVVLESRPTDNPTANSNLYILAGHENSYWESGMTDDCEKKTLLLQP